MPVDLEQIDALQREISNLKSELDDLGYQISKKLGTGSKEVVASIADGTRITIGSGDNVFKADENGICLGNKVFASAPFSVTMAGVLTATGLTITGGSVGGFIINATTITGGTTHIILDSTNKAISINNAIYGQAGIQLQYNSGTPRAYFGDGANQFFQFDGTNVSWKGTNSGLTSAGVFTASNVDDIQGSPCTFGHIFGDGSDGNVTISVDTALTADMFYNNLTIDSGKVLTTNGFRIFVLETFAGTGTVRCNGTNGGNGGNSTLGGAGGAGGTAGSSGDNGGSLDSGIDGVAGGAGGDSNVAPAGTGHDGTAGIACSYSFDGSNGVAGGAGGIAGTNGGCNGGTYGAVGARTLGAILPDVIQAWPFILLSTGRDVIAGHAGGSGAGGGGGINASNYDGGGGGGSGGCGGTIFISAKTVTFTGTFETTGGNGGNGGNGSNTGNASNDSGGGGGGAGGCGGLNCLFYISKTGSITKTVTGGTGGSAGSHTSDRTAPVAGTNGTAGISKEVHITFL